MTITLAQALEKRIPRVCNPVWDERAYLRLPLLPNNQIGPWAELYDPLGQDALGIPVGSQKVGLFQVDPSLEFEIYSGEISEYEKDNMAAGYEER